MKSNWTVAIVGAALLALPILPIPSACALEEPDLIPPLHPAEPHSVVNRGEVIYESHPEIAGTYWGHARHHRVLRGRLRGVAATAPGAIATATGSDQPVIDPMLRADWIAAQRAAAKSWHAGYYHTQWGGPVALMVPPTVRTHTRWGWGVAQTSVEPLYHQFRRPYPGPVGAAGPASPLLPTPRWPSHTDQFGVYPVRGPW